MRKPLPKVGDVRLSRALGVDRRSIMTSVRANDCIEDLNFDEVGQNKGTLRNALLLLGITAKEELETRDDTPTAESIIHWLSLNSHTLVFYGGNHFQATFF